MKLVCLDLEGVLVPEIWIEFSKSTGIKELQRTTRDESDYNRLMQFRLDILAKNNLKLQDIQKVIKDIKPLCGALDFVNALKQKAPLIILSDTFEQFAMPLMAQLSYPALFCNTLVAASDGAISGYRLRQENGKKKAVEAFKSCNIEVFAAGDSFNDLEMIEAAGHGCLFCAPQNIRDSNNHLFCACDYAALMGEIDKFLGGEK